MLEYEELTEDIICSFYDVHKQLRPGLLEKPYKNALFYALQKHGFSVEKEKHYTILYDDITVGSYFADLVLENKIIIEVKAVNEIEKNMIAQTINYLKVSELPLGFIVNFRNKSVQFRRLENKNPHNPP